MATNFIDLFQTLFFRFHQIDFTAISPGQIQVLMFHVHRISRRVNKKKYIKECWEEFFIKFTFYRILILCDIWKDVLHCISNGIQFHFSLFLCCFWNRSWKRRENQMVHKHKRIHPMSALKFDFVLSCSNCFPLNLYWNFRDLLWVE